MTTKSKADKEFEKMYIRMAIGFGAKSATDILFILRTKYQMDKSYGWLKKHTDVMVEDGVLSRSHQIKGKYLYRVAML
jgi:hypothetical protein